MQGRTLHVDLSDNPISQQLVLDMQRRAQRYELRARTLNDAAASTGTQSNGAPVLGGYVRWHFEPCGVANVPDE